MPCFAPPQNHSCELQSLSRSAGSVEVVTWEVVTWEVACDHHDNFNQTLHFDPEPTTSNHMTHIRPTLFRTCPPQLTGITNMSLNWHGNNVIVAAYWLDREG